MKKKNYTVPFAGIINLSFEDVLTLSPAATPTEMGGYKDRSGLDVLFQ